LTEENIGDIVVEKSDTSFEQQIVVEYGRSSVQVPTESRAVTILEELAEERFDEVDHLVAEQTQEQQIQVDLAQPKVEQSKLARTSTQVARLEEETADDVIKELTVEVTAGEEIQIQLDRPVKEQPQSSLTATLLARMAEEGTEELLDHVPAPSEPELSEVALELGKHDVTAMAETRAEALSEVLSVSSVEDNIEDTRETFMEGEEIAYDLVQSTTRKKEPTMVGVAEDHQSEEEEEEIFHEVTITITITIITCAKEVM